MGDSSLSDDRCRVSLTATSASSPVAAALDGGGLVRNSRAHRPLVVLQVVVAVVKVAVLEAVALDLVSVECSGCHRRSTS